MQIIGATKEDIQNALNEVNELFHDNIVFKEFEYQKTMRDGREVYKVTLTVKDSNEIGSRRSPQDYRRISAACWHAHGNFFDALPRCATIKATMGNGLTKIIPGEKWQDWNIGSLHRPCNASKACNCMEWNEGGVLPFPVNV